mgnify:CR=1 FL=1|jgi:hypothetical protein
MAAGFSVHAGMDFCRIILETGIMGGHLGYGNVLNYDLYRPYDSILFLSDGIDDTFGFRNEVKNIEGALSLGERVSGHFPGKKVVQTDFNIVGSTTKGNLTQMHLDNTADFPFNDETFDLIVMRKGMCLCCRRQPCGGFSSKHAASKQFFTRVIESLNLKNPKAMAILHGQEKANPKVVERWKRVAEELEQAYDVDISFGYAPPGYGFKAGDDGINAVPALIDQSTMPLESAEPMLGEFNSIIIRPRVSEAIPLTERL